MSLLLPTAMPPVRPVIGLSPDPGAVVMDSLGQENRFSYDLVNGFRVDIPNGLDFTLYSRASIAQLKDHLIPAVRLTRGGHLSAHQPDPPENRPYSWWLAQLVHYNQPFGFSRDEACLILKQALLNGTLRVPDDLQEMERRLRTAARRRERKVEKQDRSQQLQKQEDLDSNSTTAQAALPMARAEKRTSNFGGVASDMIHRDIEAAKGATGNADYSRHGTDHAQHSMHTPQSSAGPTWSEPLHLASSRRSSEGARSAKRRRRRGRRAPPPVFDIGTLQLQRNPRQPLKKEPGDPFVDSAQNSPAVLMPHAAIKIQRVQRVKQETSSPPAGPAARFKMQPKLFYSSDSIKDLQPDRAAAQPNEAPASSQGPKSWDQQKTNTVGRGDEVKTYAQSKAHSDEASCLHHSRFHTQIPVTRVDDNHQTPRKAKCSEYMCSATPSAAVATASKSSPVSAQDNLLLPPLPEYQDNKRVASKLPCHGPKSSLDPLQSSDVYFDSARKRNHAALLRRGPLYDQLRRTQVIGELPRREYVMAKNQKLDKGSERSNVQEEGKHNESVERNHHFDEKHRAVGLSQQSGGGLLHKGSMKGASRRE